MLTPACRQQMEKRISRSSLSNIGAKLGYPTQPWDPASSFPELVKIFPHSTHEISKPWGWGRKGNVFVQDNHSCATQPLQVRAAQSLEPQLHLSCRSLLVSYVTQTRHKDAKGLDKFLGSLSTHRVIGSWFLLEHGLIFPISKP